MFRDTKSLLPVLISVREHGGAKELVKTYLLVPLKKCLFYNSKLAATRRSDCKAEVC